MGEETGFLRISEQHPIWVNDPFHPAPVRSHRSTGVGLLLADLFWQLSCLLLSFSPLPGRGEGGSHHPEVIGTLWDWTRSAAQPSPIIEGLSGEVMSHQGYLSVVGCISIPLSSSHHPLPGTSNLICQLNVTWEIGIRIGPVGTPGWCCRAGKMLSVN